MHRRSFLATALVALTSGAAFPAAPARRLGPLTITDAWARPTPPGAPTGAGYLTIRNAGPAPDRFLGGSSPICRSLELHRMSNEGGIMRMRAVAEGVAVPPGGEVRLAPGGLHIMMIGLRRPLAPGDRFPVRLRFQRAGAIEIPFTVEQRPARPASHAGH